MLSSRGRCQFSGHTGATTPSLSRSILSPEAAVHEHVEGEQHLTHLLLMGATSQCSPWGGLILLCPAQEEAEDESTSKALSWDGRSQLHSAHAEPKFKQR